MMVSFGIERLPNDGNGVDARVTVSLPVRSLRDA